MSCQNVRKVRVVIQPIGRWERETALFWDSVFVLFLGCSPLSRYHFFLNSLRSQLSTEQLSRLCEVHRCWTCYNVRALQPHYPLLSATLSIVNIRYNPTFDLTNTSSLSHKERTFADMSMCYGQGTEWLTRIQLSCEVFYYDFSHLDNIYGCDMH